MTDVASNMVHNEMPELAADNDIAGFLQMYAHQQLTVVLTPRLMQLRRLVIGEVGRFPELARVLSERGPQRAIAALAQSFERLAARGLLVTNDPLTAASHFNWHVMSEPLNKPCCWGMRRFRNRQHFGAMQLKECAYSLPHIGKNDPNSPNAPSPRHSPTPITLQKSASGK